ncbi:MAG TPA: hypothetical protein VKP30_09370, partial [Polyangiaceae bacterium]|nr:hypothetical protein [Polyangiaceae bacterium]
MPLAILTLLGGCGTGNPAPFIAADPVATGGAPTSSGGRSASIFTSGGGVGAVAGANQTFEIVAVNDDIEAEAVGPGYRFTKWYGDWDLAILAQGDGPSVVVMVNGCDPPRFYTVPAPDDSFEVALVGLLRLDQPAALVCNGSRCLLEAGAESASDASLIRSELSPIPASETTPGDWKYLVTRGYSAEN